MKVSICILLLFSFLSCYSQNKFDIQDYTYNQWKESCDYLQVKCDTFFYADRIDSSSIECVLESLKELTVYKQMDISLVKSKIDSIVFSQKEIDFVKKTMSLNKDFSWPQRLFLNSYRLNRNQIDDFIKRVNESKLELEEKLCKSVFTFSPPFFLRNNSLCIVTIEEDNIQKTIGGTWIYVNDGDKWIKYAPLCMVSLFSYRK